MPANHKAALNIALNAVPCTSGETWIDEVVLNLAAAYCERDQQYKELLRLAKASLDTRHDKLCGVTQCIKADAALRAAIEKGEKDVS